VLAGFVIGVGKTPKALKHSESNRFLA
jgi:hypothetical protein